MDKLILAEKLEALRRCVQRVEARRPDSVQALQADVDRQDILALNLTRAVQLCVDAAGIVGRFRATGAANDGAGV